MAASDYLEDKLRRHIFGTATFTKPTALWVALFTTSPDDAGGVEVAAPSYARIQRNPGDANWTFPDAAGGEANNTAEIIFPVPDESWGQVVAVGIYDASTGGNLLTYGNLANVKTVNEGDSSPKFPAGALRSVFS
jgi:hypothetical protein